MTAIVCLGAGINAALTEEATLTTKPDHHDSSIEFLRQYAETNRFRSGQPKSIWISPDEKSVVFLRSAARDFVQHLYEFDTTTGETRQLLTASELIGGEEEELSPEEKARRERARNSARGFASFGATKDGGKLLIPLSGKLYVYDRDTRETREIGTEEGYPLDPQFSPDGSRVACVRNGELHVIDVASGRETQLTTDAGDTQSNGLAEFVAQEEMGRRHGYWWSPNGKFLAYQHTDTCGVEEVYISDPANPTAPPQSWRYPRPGKQNADVTLGIIPVDGGTTKWVDWDRATHPYLASVVWPEHGPLTILVQNRTQTEHRLLTVDPVTGVTATLLVERDSAWINLDQEMPHWLPGNRFLWTTERRGSWQVELRDSDGELVSELTALELGLHGVLSVDDDRQELYVAASDDPLTAHVYHVSFTSGAGETPRELTPSPGVHSAAFSDGHGLWVHHGATESIEPTWRVVRRDGTVLGELDSVAESPPWELNLEFVSTGTDPEFRALVVRPRDFIASQSYPVIVHIYGGPHRQMVRRVGRSYLLDQWIADQGFIVVMIDGRGTPHRGRDWERAIRYELVDVPLDDQVTALKSLGERFDELDLGRVGIFGWSYGGYMSAMATIRRGDIFRAGVAGAPVTDWHDYDTHYTERYLGLPDENPAGYETGSVLTHVEQLHRPLLLIHGTADDNVYFLHSARLSDALLRAGKRHEFLPLAGATHMVTEPEMTAQMYRRIIDFFREHLSRAAP